MISVIADCNWSKNKKHDVDSISLFWKFFVHIVEKNPTKFLFSLHLYLREIIKHQNHIKKRYEDEPRQQKFDATINFRSNEHLLS